MTILPFPTLERLELGGIPLLTDEALFQACGVRIAFTGRAGGTSKGAFESLNVGAHVDDDPYAVAANRRAILNAIDANAAPLISPNQVHGTRILQIHEPVDIGRVADEALDGCDALQVDVPGVAAMLGFADCLPLILVAPSGRFAVVHAGWRGAVAHISRDAARLLTESGEDPSEFNAYIGPHIGAECFEVGEDVARQFAEEFGDDVVSDVRHVSLAGAVSRDLVSAGMNVERIADCGICTVCHSEEYFSYRAMGGECGRQSATAFRPYR